MRQPKATFSGSFEQAQLAALELLNREISHPYSRKIVTVQIQVAAEYHDPDGEWGRLEILKQLERNKLIKILKTFKDNEYLDGYGLVETVEARVQLVPAKITKQIIQLNEFLAWDLASGKLRWKNLVYDKVLGRFEYNGVNGRLIGKQKAFLTTIMTKERAKYSVLYNAMNPNQNRIVQVQKQVGYTLRALKKKLGIKPRGNPDIFGNVEKWGYELI